MATMKREENRKLFSKVSIVLIIALPVHFPHFLCPSIAPPAPPFNFEQVIVHESERRKGGSVVPG